MNMKTKRRGTLLIAFFFMFFLLMGMNKKVQAATISSGYYSISSKVNNNFALSVKNADKSNKANIQLGIKSGYGSPQMVFKISSCGGGYYKVSAMHSGKFLDVAGASNKAGANLQQYQNNTSNGQRWKFISDGSGYYYIQSKLGTYINAVNGKAFNGNNVNLGKLNRANGQRWKLTKMSKYVGVTYDSATFSSSGGRKTVAVHAIGNWSVSSSQSWVKVSKSSGKITLSCGKNTGLGRSATITLKNGSYQKKFIVKQREGSATISSGSYAIASAINTNFVVDVDGGKTDNMTNVQLWQDGSANQQKFQITYVSDGYYKIIATHSGKVLDIASGSNKEGTNIWQYSYNGSAAQLWRFINAGNGYYYIKSKLGLYLDAMNGTAGNGNNVWGYSLNKSNAQKWKLVKKAKGAIYNGLYTVATKVNENYVLDIDGGKTEDQTNLQLWQKSSVNQQKFNIISVSGEYYRIQAAHSGKVLDVAGCSNKSGTNVWQYTYNGSAAQLWRFVSAGNGYYYIQSKLGSYLDAYGATAGNGNNVWAYSLNKTNAQKWKLSKTSLVAPPQNNGIKLQVYMSNSMKQGDYSQFVVGGSNVGCMSTAYAIGYSIVDKRNYNPVSFWTGSQAYDALGRCGAYTPGFNSGAIYNALKNGKPSLLHYYYAGGGQHWVTIIGVRSGANTNNLQASDFIVIDPATGTERYLSNCYKFGSVQGYKIFK